MGHPTRVHAVDPPPPQVKLAIVQMANVLETEELQRSWRCCGVNLRPKESMFMKDTPHLSKLVISSQLRTDGNIPLHFNALHFLVLTFVYSFSPNMSGYLKELGSSGSISGLRPVESSRSSQPLVLVYMRAGGQTSGCAVRSISIKIRAHKCTQREHRPPHACVFVCLRESQMHFTRTHTNT